jgi:hypothetical protein
MVKNRKVKITEEKGTVSSLFTKLQTAPKLAAGVEIMNIALNSM